MLKRIFVVLAAVCSTASTASTAQSPFLGEWTLAASRSRMPDEMKVESKGSNRYAFDFGEGAFETIVLDGGDQPGFAGTLLSVKAQAPDSWIVTRKQGSRLLLKATWTLSNDQSTLTDNFREFESDGSTLSVDYVYERVGGGSGFAADWRSVKETINSPMLLSVKAFQGDGLSFVDPLLKRTRSLKAGGKEYSPDDGSHAGRGAASSSVRRVDERTVLVTDKRDGKVTDTERFMLSNDLKTLTMTVAVVGHDKPIVLLFERK